MASSEDPFADEVGGGGAGEADKAGASSHGMQGLTLTRSPAHNRPSEQSDDDAPMCGPDGAIPRDFLQQMDDFAQQGNTHEGLPSTPPRAGFDTPSEPNTPSPRNHPLAQQPQYGGGWGPQNQCGDGANFVDQWDWKTDAPEFVPGSMKGFADQGMGQGFQQPWMMQAAPGPPLGKGGPPNIPPGDDTARLSQLRANYEWQLRSKGDELREMQQRMNQVEIETAQVRASWESERRGLVRQIGHYRSVLERYCIPVEEAGAPSYNMDDPTQFFPAFEPSAPSQWPSTASNQVHHPASSSAVRQNPGPFAGNDGSYQQPPQGMVPFGPGPGGGVPPPMPMDSGGGGGAASSSLDSKMRQLNNLLQEGSSQSRNNAPAPSPPVADSDANGGQDGSYTDKSIASTLRAMFPHATIRTKATPGAEGEGDEGGEDEYGEPGSPEALDHDFGGPGAQPPPPRPPRDDIDSFAARLDKLQSTTNDRVDERALRTFQVLSHRDKVEAVGRLEQQVVEKGSQFRNLSSALQTICRKIQEGDRSSKSKNDRAPNGVPPPPDSPPPRTGPSSQRTRRADDDRDAFDHSGSDREAQRRANAATWQRSSPTSEGRAPDLKTLESGRRIKSWADVESGDEDEVGEGLYPAGPGFKDGSGEPSQERNDPWTKERIDAAARQGFELTKSKRGHWELKIVMSALDPPLTHLGMEKYCVWLRDRLSQFREENGKDSLWKCKSEVDFSHNRLNNQMVWILLETLAQQEVQVAILKLFANNITQGGMLAITEFIRMNDRAEAVQELHLSHNGIDDDSAFELLKALEDLRPKYPPKRFDGKQEIATPLWLRLNHNRIRDATAFLKRAEDANLSVCTSWDRNVCGPSKCQRRDCPLVHLYSFQVQDGENGDGRHQKHRDRDGGNRRKGNKMKKDSPEDGRSSPQDETWD